MFIIYSNIFHPWQCHARGGHQLSKVLCTAPPPTHTLHLRIDEFSCKWNTRSEITDPEDHVRAKTLLVFGFSTLEFRFPGFQVAPEFCMSLKICRRSMEA